MPRVRELIDVGMTILKEETLTMCFQVNDDLCKILDDVEHPEKRAVSGGGSANATSLDSLDFDAFGFEDKKKSVAGDHHKSDDAAAADTLSAKPATSKIASSALEDLLAPPSASPSAAGVSAGTGDDDEKKKGKSKSGGDDEFDDFFGERQVGTNNSFSIDE